MLLSEWLKRIETKKVFLDVYSFFCFLGMRRQNFTIKNKNMWRKTIKNCYRSDKNVERDDWKDWIHGFSTSNLRIIKQCRVPIKKTDPIVVSVVRDERKRLPIFLAYYRELGIKRFAIIDNNSCDDSIKWLIDQYDVDVFSCTDIFSDRRKVGWSNRVMGFYGVNRWFLLLDGDEFIDWPQRREHNLAWMIRNLENKHIFQGKALMVDMYPKDGGGEKAPLFDIFEKAYSKADYFDIDSYYEKNTQYGKVMTGGIRKRVFDYEVWLTKYPLFYLEESRVVLNAHLLYPIPIYKRNPYYFVIRHYKFVLKEDIEKIKKYSREENFCEKSKNTKIYFSNYKLNKFHFYYEGSCKFYDPESLGKIGYIEIIE